MTDQDWLHIIPTEDLRDHEPRMTCWCRPTEDCDTPGLWAHHSMYLRERFEEGERLPS